MVWDDTNPDLGNSIAEDIADLKENANTYFLDEDNMASDSATAVASQQSVKAYVDTADRTAQPAARAYLGSSDQSIPNDTWTKVAFNATDFDTLTEFDTTTDYDYTVTHAGKYLVCTSVRVDDLDDGEYAEICLVTNGSAVSRQRVYAINAEANQYISLVLTDIVDVSAGTTIWAQVYQNSGVARNLQYGSQWSWISICKIA